METNEADEGNDRKKWQLRMEGGWQRWEGEKREGRWKEGVYKAGAGGGKAVDGEGRRSKKDQSVEKRRGMEEHRRQEEPDGAEKRKDRKGKDTR